jgi:hypothetical protein
MKILRKANMQLPVIQPWLQTSPGYKSIATKTIVGKG